MLHEAISYLGTGRERWFGALSVTLCTRANPFTAVDECNLSQGLVTSRQVFPHMAVCFLPGARRPVPEYVYGELRQLCCNTGGAIYIITGARHHRNT